MATGRKIKVELRKWRSMKGLSQRQAADVLGVPKRTLQEWEQGRRSPRGLARFALWEKLKEQARQHRKSLIDGPTAAA